MKFFILPIRKASKADKKKAKGKGKGKPTIKPVKGSKKPKQ